MQITNSLPSGAVVYKKIPSLYPKWNTVTLWNSVRKLPVGTRERQVVWGIFCKEYRDKLNKLGARKIIEQLTDGDVLLGWFRRNCHRQILMRYLREHGVEVEELVSGSTADGILYPRWESRGDGRIDTMGFGIRQES